MDTKMITLKSKRYLCFTALVLIIATGCGSNKEAQADAKQGYVLPDSLTKTLDIVPATNSSVVKSINLTGKVSFNEDNVVKVYPMVSGIARDVRVMLGDYVTAGQELAVINSSEMAGYSSDLITAESNLKVTKKNMDAAQDMYKSGLTSSRDYLAAESAYEQAQAALLKAKRVIGINGGNTNGSFMVKAPINGFIVEKMLTNNMSIRADNTSNLFTISDLRNVWVIANVYESDIPFIKMGDSVEVNTISYPDHTFYGKVDKIMNVLDPTNKVMKVRVVLANPGYLLKPEMFANVTVLSKASNGNKMIAIPSKALIFDNSQNYVLVYNSNSDIIIRPVIVASTAGEKTYIQGGLKEGEKVISNNALLIYQQLNS